MQRRSDRYRETVEPVEEVKKSRVNKNHTLYDEINSKIGFEEITPYNSDEQINLSSLDMGNLKRGEYQRVKDYKVLLEDKEDVNDQEKVEKVAPKKNYDINKVLEEAKKNREIDELEGKRNLKDDDYNVLNTLNRKYLHQKGFTEEDNEELKELIDTITSKTLVDDIRDDEEKELLSELLATTIDVQLESELSNTQIMALTESSSDEEELTDTNSFYSKSLELSGNDLLGDKETEDNSDDDDEKEIDLDDDRNVFKIILISVLLLIVVLVVGYFVLQFLGVSFN